MSYKQRITRAEQHVKQKSKYTEKRNQVQCKADKSIKIL